MCEDYFDHMVSLFLVLTWLIKCLCAYITHFLASVISNLLMM